MSGLVQFIGHFYTEPLHKTCGKAPVMVTTGGVLAQPMRYGPKRKNGPPTGVTVGGPDQADRHRKAGL